MIKWFLIFLLFSSTQFLQGQDIQSLMVASQNYHDVNPQEKLYLHLDKPAYTAGETIWIKTYATIGIQNLLSNFSALAYIELIDPKDQVVNAIKIPLVMGLGVADIALSDTLTEGSYRLRAYTNWMRNAAPQFFYDRTLNIANGSWDNLASTTTLLADGNKDTYQIKLHTLDGAPLKNTYINFEFVKEGKVLGKKTLRTNQAGEVDVAVDQKHGDVEVRYAFETPEKRAVNKVFKAISPDKQNSVQVFPEGGKLVSNRTNHVAVKALNPRGLGVKATVYFLSGQDTIGKVKTNVLGMGASTMFLLPQTSLTALVEYEDGVRQEVPLPTVHESGYSLMVNNQLQNRLIAQLHLSDDLVDDQDIYFLVQHLGKIFLASKQQASGNQVSFSANTAELPNGVLTLTVLNHQLVPITERPFFHYDPSKQLPVSVVLDKENYVRRAKVQVAVDMSEATDSVRIGAFSASVLHLGKVEEAMLNEAPDIISSLLLQSDIKGFVENPKYYFQEGQVNKKELDYLMLTQGWRNIDWKEIGQAKEKSYAVEKGVKISGHVRKFGRSAPEPHAIVQLFPSKSLLEYVERTADENGYFEFNHLLFPDSINFVLSARDSNGKNRVDLHVDEQEPPSVGRNRNDPLEINDVNALMADQIKDAKQYFKELHRIGMMEGSILIDEVLVTRRIGKASPRSANRNGPGNADHVFSGEELTGYQNMEQFFTARIPGIRWNIETGLPKDATFMLDGMPIDSMQANLLDFSRLESVEVLRTDIFTASYRIFMNDDMRMEGVERRRPVIFVLTSKPGESALNRRTIPKGILTLNTKGLYAERTFYKPDYDVSDAPKLQKDVRTTIHWEPSIVISKEGKAMFDFFTSDEPGTYRITLEGIDVNGKLARKVLDFEVK